MSEHRIEVTVNGRRHDATEEARDSLGEFLRETLGYTGTHLACEHGVCGACTVMVEGKAVRSCLMLAVQASRKQGHDSRWPGRRGRYASPGAAGYAR